MMIKSPVEGTSSEEKEVNLAVVAHLEGTHIMMTGKLSL